MIALPCILRSLSVLSLLWNTGDAQMLGEWANRHRVMARQNGDGNNNGQPDTSAFNIVNGRIFTPGLGIILAVRPSTSSPHPSLTPTSPNPSPPWAATSSTSPSTSQATASSLSPPSPSPTPSPKSTTSPSTSPASPSPKTSPSQTSPPPRPPSQIS